jgi:hypothetical protein
MLLDGWSRPIIDSIPAEGKPYFNRRKIAHRNSIEIILIIMLVSRTNENRQSFTGSWKEAGHGRPEIEKEARR